MVFVSVLNSEVKLWVRLVLFLEVLIALEDLEDGCFEDVEGLEIAICPSKIVWNLSFITHATSGIGYGKPFSERVNMARIPMIWNLWLFQA